MNLLIVDDDISFRTFMRQCLRELEGIQVVGTAGHGRDALLKMQQLKPNLVTLDMDMPHFNAIEILHKMQLDFPHIRVIIIASSTETDAQRTVAALEAGAYDFILKPEGKTLQHQHSFQEKLFPAMQQAQSVSKVVGLQPRKAAVNKIPAPKLLPNSSRATRPDIVAIGSSTGGPAALHQLLTQLPANFPTPITITQHMPKMFLASLAQRIDKDSPLTCKLAQDGETLKAGRIYLAPGDTHMKIERQGVYLAIALEAGERVHHCIPAVDVTYHSLAALAPRIKTLAVVLTGMGNDGALGAKALADKKSIVIAQDKNSSTVWGMPGETVRLGAAQEVLPLEDIAQALCRHVGLS
ncbi:MAG: chemotaxis-specific protein-glutamate methyltransferase CheB [Mariprofundaceae bacterium]|nr:chemotaxis-specific protein-glutamate methyltransferase CheB [Mariprofundaceae bacterium]